MALNKDNSGVLFRYKKSNDRQPDFRGEAMVNGKKIEISGWNRTSDKGTEYVGLIFKEPYKNEH